jgi:quinol monooxygenase YgiN
MFKPLIFISTWKIKEGRLEAYKQFASEFIEHVKAKEPQLIAFNMYFNEDETEMTSIQVHPDAASMDFHMQVLAKVIGQDMIEWINRADFLEPKHIEIYGTPSAKLLEADQQLVDAGIPRSVKPLHFAGFTRSAAG